MSYTKMWTIWNIHIHGMYIYIFMYIHEGTLASLKSRLNKP